MARYLYIWTMSRYLDSRVIARGVSPGARTEREFSGGIVFIVSGLKTYLETGEPLAAATA
jgi:hypothetical protein